MKRAVKSRAKALGQIRIIAGRWRGRKLPVPDVEGLRPTTDRNKETLFNWLAPYVAGRQCLDAFAGSGGLGFEALSRYAARVDFVEQDTGAVRMLRENAGRLGLSSEQAAVHQGDMLQILSRLSGPFSLVFLDPPFNKGLLQRAVDALVQSDKLAAEALLYLEMEKGAPLLVPSHWQLLKHKQNSQVDYRLYQLSMQKVDNE
ncbi:16S rRNA (guanine(966)-N(2))-methyltransferase RsmD [Lacimicrobium alkaliphilum]|uniref:Ribosomal RNA small subunit methyltransferase D n=1 Tax=Lacimicrobium alkaliphilum TaxID=1526571 RepID=A0A0U3AWE1_9ALTE|nr:16S rRNA (guanine(966)-N(2))-methyltransferase RsmD [Lacimicrobium alkaliphilum]ALS97216.1 16S rRNA (guanine(966)-N(2))-methyltransferase RsmD [Lacimicrobium alkaliphilum]